MVVIPNTTPDLELLSELFAHPLEPVNYMVASDSKSSLLASNSSKSRTCSFVAKRYRQIWWNFLALRERELINTNLENLGKRKKLMIKERKIEASQRSFGLSKRA